MISSEFLLAALIVVLMPGTGVVYTLGVALARGGAASVAAAAGCTLGIVPSILAAIGGVIERHLIEIGFIAGEGMGLAEDPAAEVRVVGGLAPSTCPNCGGFNLVLKEGCETCLDCGHSKCG